MSSNKRYRSKEARELARAVHRAGGTVELTGKGHLKVRGPRGMAIVASAPHTNGRDVANSFAIVEKHTGLELT